MSVILQDDFSMSVEVLVHLLVSNLTRIPQLISQVLGLLQVNLCNYSIICFKAIFIPESLFEFYHTVKH